MDKTAIEKAKRARISAKIQLSKVDTFVKNEARTASSSKLSVKLEILEKYYTAFHKAQEEIESLTEESDLPKEIEESENFDESYCDLKADLLDLIEKATPSTASTNHTHNNERCNSHADEQLFKLPTIQIKKFNGDFLEWTSFKDLFQSMIGSRKVSNVNKLCLLRSVLDGEPYDLIKVFPITDENYNEAWQKLEDRYTNKSLIIKAHLSQIFSLEKCTGNAHSLKRVLDSITTHVRSLENLDLERSSMADAILFHIVTSKLDQRTKELFDEERDPDTTESSYVRLIKFLTLRVNTLADLPSGKDLTSHQTNQPKPKRADAKVHQITTPTPSTTTSDTPLSLTPNANSFSKYRTCIECSGNHPLYKCQQFSRKTVAERFETVKNAKEPICFNCFRSFHRAASCTDPNSCKECGQKHHTMLHIPKKPTPPSAPVAVANTSTEAEAKVCTVTHLATKQVLLATVLLLVKDAYGQNQRVRAFLDPGAQANLITKRLAERLCLPIKPIALTLSGVTNMQRKLNQTVKCEISSRVSEFKTSLHAVIVSEICTKLPSQLVSTVKLPLHDKLLADPEFHKPNDVDLLLSGENYLDLFTDGHIPETAETPSMRNTVFGWIIAGKSTIAKSNDDIHEVLVNHCFLSTTPPPLVNHCAISAALEKFWSIEDVNTVESLLTIEEQACEKHFVENTTRLDDGRFEVAIPFKADPSVLGTSRDTAVRVLKYTQKRLNAEQRAEYHKFMDEYQKLGHMVKLPNPDFAIPHAYLPHHPVIKTSSMTTKLRVVFNGSKPTSSGVAVNEIQMKGGTLQNEIFVILFRFRFHKIAICVDVEKMYRQAKVRREDQEFQRIVWFDSFGEIVDFLLTTVTYGMTASAFLAIRCLIELALKDGHEFPLAAKAILEEFFVDDGITGAATLAEAIELVRQLIGLCAKGQFTLRKWASNHPSVLQGVESQASDVEFLINSDETVGTLGISWLPTDDKFVLAVNLQEEPEYNKRNILSEIAKIFDPLGLVAPVVIKFKLFLRELWKRGCNWDEPLDLDLRDQWKLYRQSILSLRIECPRLVLPGATQNYEIHGFCDASKEAFCACIYIRCKNNGQYNTELLCSKSRVAPLREQHIHRLELMGAVLLANLLSKITAHQLSPPTAMHMWCDSQVALAWIKKDPSQLKTFVGNRVQQIQASIPSQFWHYVNTHDNPADIGSRGATGDNLRNSNLWWKGPAFLLDKNLPINTPEISEPIEAAREFKKPKVTVLSTSIAEEFNLFHRFESATKLTRVIAWWLRFKNNLRIKNDSDRLRTPLQAQELTAAKIVLVRLAQRDDFDVERLQRKGIVSKKSKLRPLAPFVDENGLIRVGGRLQNTRLSRNQRHPMVLSSTHPFAEAIVREQHRNWCHPPRKLAMAVIREEYWIIGLKKLVKKIATSCIACRKARAKFITQQMGQLPPDRVNPSFAFLNVGLDYAGPIDIAVNSTRRRATRKAYICLFVCLATKAIHIEAVTSLTSNAFLDALSRMVARRGKPALIRSDNGTNFKGAYNDLIKIIRSEPVQNPTANEGISWEFIPPSAPHCGGIWEAGIKSVKTFLRKFNEGKFDYEEFSTILTKIEGFLNSRPLNSLSDDPNDLEALTPGHFLIGRPLFALPERNQIDSRDNRDRFIIRQRLVQQFWREWQADYLHRLQQRPKWMEPKTNIQEGQLVLLREVTSPQTWILGRVSKVYPGTDGLVRVADVVTAKGTVKRHISKLVAL